MQHRTSDGGHIVVDRKIPLWGILLFCASIVGSSYSLYSSYVTMAASVDKLTLAMERQREIQTASAIKDIQHDAAIQQNTNNIADMKRDVEDLKKTQRWAPR